MKRDPDLIRRIAFATEDLKPNQYLSEIDGVDGHEFAHNLQLMIDGGMIDGRVQHHFGPEPPAACAIRLTWEGCDFIDAARSDTLWAKAKKSVIAPTASWTFGILKDWLKEEIRTGFPTLGGGS